MTGKLKTKPATRRDAADTVRLKAEGAPSHINAREAALLERLMPEAAGPVVTKGLLAEAGRRGDDRVTKLIPAEAALLKARGGAGTRNPESGLLEFYGGDDGGGMSGGVGDDSGGTSHGGGHSDSDSFGGGDGGGGGLFSGRLESRAYDPMSMPAIESLLAAPDFAQPGMGFTQYAPRDTWARAWQEYWNPSVRAPGRLGAPNAHGPGIMGSFVSQLAGGPFSAAMGWGGAMGRASSKETQEASAKEDAARSAHNSTGNQGSHNLNDIDAALSKMAGYPLSPLSGEQSGARTAELPQVPPGFMLNPAGQIVPMASQGNDRPAYQDPIRNLLHDYIWRGPSGRGWG